MSPMQLHPTMTYETEQPSNPADDSIPVMYLDDTNVTEELPEPRLPRPRSFSTMMTELEVVPDGNWEVTIVSYADGIEFIRNRVKFAPHESMSADSLNLNQVVDVAGDDTAQLTALHQLYVETMYRSPRMSIRKK